MVFQDEASIKIFFSLLRSGLYGEPIPESELPENIDWKAVASFAQKQTVLGIIIDSIQFLPERLRPSESISAKMKKFALGLIKANLVLDSAVARLVTFLKQHGINGVLLKGQGVARYYRAPQMRHTGDIDFYVGKTLYKKAVDLCKEKWVKGDEEILDCEKHFSFFMSGIVVELHRIAARIYSPFKMKSFQNWIVEELEHSPARRVLTIDNAEVILPPVDFEALYIFYHAWSHYIMGGIGLRQLCDWAMIFNAHGNDIDRQQLKKNISRFGLIKGWKLFACIAVNYLGVPVDKMPLYDPSYRKKSEKIMEEIIAGGNFGFYSKEFASYGNHKYGFMYGLAKFPAVTKYFISLFTLIPVEATFLYFNRLYHGAISCTKKSVSKLNNNTSPS